MKAPPLLPLFPPVQGLFFAFLFFSLLGPVHSQIQPAWVQRYNHNLPSGQHQALKMALGSDNNIYVCGFSQNANSNLDYAVLKYASNGVLSWVARLDSTNEPQAQPTGFALDPANNSSLTGNAGTVSFDSNGNQRWLAPYAGLAVAVDSASNTFVTGFGTNFNTVKLGPSGTNVWMATYNDAGPSLSKAVAVDNAGNVLVAGSDVFGYWSTHFGGSIPQIQFLITKFRPDASLAWSSKSGADPNWAYGITMGGFQLDSAGNVYADYAQEENSFLSGEFSGSDGHLIWGADNPTQNSASLANGLAVDAGNNVYLTGQDDYHSTPNCSYTTFKISTNGTYLWGEYYPYQPTASNPSTQANAATAIALDSNANSYVTGYSPDSNGTNDIVTIAYDTNGKQLWLQRYTGLGYGTVGNAIACDNNGNVYVAGYENVPGGGAQMVLIKYAPVTLQRQTNGNFLLQAQGSPNQPFDIQASTNLTSWLDLGSHSADTNGLLQYLDTNASLFPSRFYLAIPH